VAEIVVVNKRILGRPVKPPEGVVRVVVHRGTPLGNPFKMANSSESERVRVCEEYARWLPGKLLEEGAELRQFQELLKLSKSSNRLELICYCAPKRCHADFIKALLEESLDEEWGFE
jgi:hypothetical protein